MLRIGYLNVIGENISYRSTFYMEQIHLLSVMDFVGLILLFPYWHASFECNARTVDGRHSLRVGGGASTYSVMF
jgi:hypothetical protein